MTNEIYKIKNIVILGAFITCMYFGFTYKSGWAFFGAMLAFLSLGDDPD